MNFICDPCKTGADIVPGDNPESHLWEMKKDFHAHCKGGTWCDCQCRVGKKNA